MYRYRLQKWGIRKYGSRKQKDQSPDESSGPVESPSSVLMEDYPAPANPDVSWQPCRYQPPHTGDDENSHDPTLSSNTVELPGNHSNQHNGYFQSFLCSQECDAVTSSNLVPTTVREISKRHVPSPIVHFCGDGLDRKLSLNPESSMHSLYRVLQAILVKIVTFNHAIVDYVPENTASDSFWMDINYSIYLLKVGTTRRAWPLLNRACDTALQSEFTDLPSLCDLLIILSPVNMRVCPEVRKVLLHYLHQISHMKYGPNHPSTVLLLHLVGYDMDNEFVERIMSYLQDILCKHWGAFHPISEKARIASVKLLRRGRHYDKAHLAAIALVADMQYGFGKTSTRARRAARQLEHVLIDTQDYEKALGVCYGIIGYTGIEDNDDCARESNIIEDKVSVYTMEDIAKIFENTGRPYDHVEWLKRAADLGAKLWPPEAICVQHILDKLEAAEQHDSVK